MHKLILTRFTKNCEPPQGVEAQVALEEASTKITASINKIRDFAKKFRAAGQHQIVVSLAIQIATGDQRFLLLTPRELVHLSYLNHSSAHWAIPRIRQIRSLTCQGLEYARHRRDD